MEELKVAFILDKSGSMQSVRDVTISGFNEYLTTLKAKTDTDVKFSLTLFDTEITEKYSGEKLENVKPLDVGTYQPAGNTALYDAACRTIAELKKTDTPESRYCIVIMTDGEENSSQEYTQTQFKSFVEELQKTNRWTFVFLGANQDAWANAQKWGFAAANVSSFNNTDVGVAKTMYHTANASMDWLNARGMNTSSFFSEEEKTEMKNTK